MEDISAYKVKINVGGKRHEISRSLLIQYPDSMIGRLVSDTWRKSDHDEEVFIDRDGDMFSHILNYMRYKSIELPTSVPKSMFMRELDFYGIECCVGHIREESPVEALKDMKRNLLQSELHHDMLLIATTCYHHFMMGERMVAIKNSSLLGEQLKHSPFYYHFRDANQVLNYYLRRFYALKATAPQASLTSVDFLLEVKHINEGDSNDCTHYFAKTIEQNHSNVVSLQSRECDETAPISVSDLMTH